MATKTKKRHEPKQERARKTFARILETTQDLILKEGMDSLTTNKVAEHAHINIATLYHYFPDKESILEALAEHYQTKIIEHVRSRTTTVSELSLEETIKVILYGFIEFTEMPGNSLIPQLLIFSRKGGISPMAGELENTLLQMGVSILATKSGEIKSDNLYASMHIVFYSTITVIAKHLIQPDNQLSSEVIVEELAKMICTYLGASYGETS